VIRVIERLVTTQAVLSLPHDREKLDFIRMPDRRPMAVLALDRRVRRCIEHLDLFLVTLDAALASQVFDGKVLPLLHVAQPMEVIGKTRAVNPEIFRYQELPGDENHHDQSDSQPQRA
jgi:hypothetical protein